TGVQTCALPIYGARAGEAGEEGAAEEGPREEDHGAQAPQDHDPGADRGPEATGLRRGKSPHRPVRRVGALALLGVVLDEAERGQGLDEGRDLGVVSAEDGSD